MKKKVYVALGLMSGTSMDGVDASIISSLDGTHYDGLGGKYFKYNEELYRNLTNLRDKIHSSRDLSTYANAIKILEREITLFHAKVANEMINSSKIKPEIIGFHGQTLFHNSDEKISIQIGDGKLLSQLTKKTVAYNFRQNDLINGGQGAPLTPIFHKAMVRKIFKDNEWPVLVLNIGGISNATCIPKNIGNNESSEKKEDLMFAADIGPGNCLIDEWIRKNSRYQYDKDGLIASSGRVNDLILNQALDNFSMNYNESLDIKDFDISFVRGLSLEDGAATLTKFTAKIISEGIISFLKKNRYKDLITGINYVICGGGRKNKYLMHLLKSNLNFTKFSSSDKLGIDGDFIEAQAFAYIAIRSFLKLPISFPKTTGCERPTVGGIIIKKF